MYKISKFKNIIRISDGANIPPDPGNTDYREYLQWVAEGNTPEPLSLTTFDKLSAINIDQGIIQSAGFTCSNGIKLQVREIDLNRWNQLMTGLLAFKPTQVEIRDYSNGIHILTLNEATQMLAEVFVWGQNFLSDTWAKKDAIIKGA